MTDFDAWWAVTGYEVAKRAASRANRGIHSRKDMIHEGWIAAREAWELGQDAQGAIRKAIATMYANGTHDWARGRGQLTTWRVQRNLEKIAAVPKESHPPTIVLDYETTLGYAKPKQREVLDATIGKGLSIAQAAEALGVTDRTVCRRKKRGLEEMKEGIRRTQEEQSIPENSVVIWDQGEPVVAEVKERGVKQLRLAWTRKCESGYYHYEATVPKSRVWSPKPW